MSTTSPLFLWLTAVARNDDSIRKAASNVAEMFSMTIAISGRIAKKSKKSKASFLKVNLSY